MNDYDMGVIKEKPSRAQPRSQSNQPERLEDKKGILNPIQNRMNNGPLQEKNLAYQNKLKPRYIILSSKFINLVLEILHWKK